jgi:hypothetical protein
MGKAARNEQIKLRATLLNNIAVGLVIAGGLVPYLSFISATAASKPLSFWMSTATGEDTKKFLAVFVVVIAAFVGAVVLHGMATKLLSKIED